METKKPRNQDTPEKAGGPYRLQGEVNEDEVDSAPVLAVSTKIRYALEDAVDFLGEKYDIYSRKIIRATPIIGDIDRAFEWFCQGFAGSMKYAQRVTRSEQRELDRAREMDKARKKNKRGIKEE